MAFGTFDIFHPGHENFLKQAKKYGRLIVVIGRDRTVKQVKGKLPLHNEKRRQRAVKAAGIADIVILGSLADKYAAIKKYQPDIIALGYDQFYFTEPLKQFKIKIVRLKAYKPEKYKTSILKKSNMKILLSSNNQNKIIC